MTAASRRMRSTLSAERRTGAERSCARHTLEIAFLYSNSTSSFYVSPHFNLQQFSGQWSHFILRNIHGNENYHSGSAPSPCREHGCSVLITTDGGESFILASRWTCPVTGLECELGVLTSDGCSEAQTHENSEQRISPSSSPISSEEV